jgi:uncharacterized protein YkwD
MQMLNFLLIWLAWLPQEAPFQTAQGPQAIEQEIHARINQHRKSKGKAPLLRDARIDLLARRHSEEMAAGRRPFSHEGFDSRAREMSRFFPGRYGGAAENVFYSTSSDQVAASAVKGWVASQGHRVNLEGAYTHTGIGVARSASGTSYATQLFVRVRR